METTLTRDLSVAFVLDSDGLVKTVFVKDSNVTAFNDLRIASGVNGSFALANSPVYSGYDAVITGGTAGNEIKYVVTYTNGRSDAEKTVTVDASDNATISVAKNTDYITITGYSGATTPTPPTGGSNVTIDSSMTSWKFYNAADNSELTKGTDPVNGDNVQIPAGVKEIYIQNSTWTAGSFIGFGTTSYEVTAGKSIKVEVDDLTGPLVAADFKTVYSISVPANVTVTENSGGTVYTDADGVVYLEGTATAKLTGLTGTHYTADGGTSFNPVGTDTVSVSSANKVIEDGYTTFALASDPSATGGVTVASAITSGTTQASGTHYVKVGDTVVVTYTLTGTVSNTNSGYDVTVTIDSAFTNVKDTTASPISGVDVSGNVVSLDDTTNLGSGATITAEYAVTSVGGAITATAATIAELNA